MIKNIELTPAGVEKFNRFFAAHAKDGVDLQATTLDMMNVIQERVAMDESLSYELGRQYTLSGRAQLLTLDATDVEVTCQADDD